MINELGQGSRHMYLESDNEQKMLQDTMNVFYCNDAK